MEPNYPKQMMVDRREDIDDSSDDEHDDCLLKNKPLESTAYLYAASASPGDMQVQKQLFG